jgi:hypothetical protein
MQKSHYVKAASFTLQAKYRLKLNAKRKGKKELIVF